MRICIHCTCVYSECVCVSAGEFNLPVIREHEKIRPDYTWVYK